MHGVFATGALAGCLGGTKTLGRHGVFATGVLTGCLGATKTFDRHGVFATDTLAGCLGRTKTLCRHNVFATGALTAASESLKRSTGIVFSPQNARDAWCFRNKEPALEPLYTSKTLCFRARSHKTLARHGFCTTGAFMGCLGATKTLDWHGVFATGAAKRSK